MKKRTGILFLAVLILTNLLTFRLAGGGKLPAGMDTQKLMKLQAVEDYVKENYLREVNEEDFFTGQLKGVVNSLNDPYSEYLTKDDLKRLSEVTSGTFYGVGIVVSPGEDNLITVISPIKNTPADRAGIKAGDKIIKVNDKEYTASEMQDAVDAMKGEKGTKVKLQILTSTEDNTEIRNVDIVRDEVRVDTIIKDRIGNFGYIGITQFSELTASDFHKALAQLRQEGMDGLILDLRGNPGGIVEAATSIADELLPEGTIVTSKNREGEVVDEYKSDAAHLEVPLVVLINRGSASASEILSGAIKDYKAGVLIGETTFGKGVIQVVRQFPGGDGIKLTTAEYFTPNGVNIHGVGIEPDIPVAPNKDGTGIGVDYLDQDVQLQRAVEELKNMN